MVKFKVVVIFYIFIYTYTVTPKLLLKIEYDQNGNKHLQLNNINITFINKTDSSNESEKYFERYEALDNVENSLKEKESKTILHNVTRHVLIPVEPIYDKRIAINFNNNGNTIFNNQNSKFETNNQFNSVEMKNKPIDLSRKIPNHEEVKDNLDKFEMRRRKTYHATPEFNFPHKQPMKRNNIQSYHYTPEFNFPSRIPFRRNYVRSELVENIETVENNANEVSEEGPNEIDELTPQENNNIKKMYQLFNKQEDLLRRIKLRIEGIKKPYVKREKGAGSESNKGPNNPIKNKPQKHTSNNVVTLAHNPDKQSSSILGSNFANYPIRIPTIGRDKKPTETTILNDPLQTEKTRNDSSSEAVDGSAPFNDIIKSIENNMTSTTPKPEATTKFSLTHMLDETMIRRALRGDPFMQRILRIAKKKRENYLKQLATKIST